MWCTSAVAYSRDDRVFYIRAREKRIAPAVSFGQANVMVHVGPVMRRLGAGGWDVLSMTPWCSIRFERYAADVIRMLGLRALIGKTSMGERTARTM